MSKKRSATVVLTVVAALGLVGAGAAVVVTRGWASSWAHGAVAAVSSSSPAQASESSSAPTKVGDPSLAPVTGVTHGADPLSGQTLATDAPVTAPGSAVHVAITFYGWNASTGEVVVGGYAAGVVEDGGTCTLTVTKGGAKATAVKAAAADASTTTCGRLRIPRAQLAAGTWQAVLSYRSSGHTGTSDAVAIEVTA